MANISGGGGEDLLEKVLVGVETDGKYSLDTPRTKLTKEAARFMLFNKSSPAFALLSHKLFVTIEDVIKKVKDKGYRSYSTTEAKLWRRFHLARQGNLEKVWKEFWQTLQANEIYMKDPILMQHCNAKLFEQLIKREFPTTREGIITSENLSDEEENALHYAAGYVIKSVRVKISRTSHPHKSAMIDILNKLKEDKSDAECDSSYLSYTKLWIEKVNRGGLYVISDETHILFLAIEYAVRSCLAINPVDRLISEWVTIHGFSLAAAFMEDYKYAQHVTLKAKKSLRKELQKENVKQSE